jgi:TPR repeat protein
MLVVALGCANGQGGGDATFGSGQDDESLALLREAAEAGDPKAQSQLAFAYQEGSGVEVDPAAAAEWHRKAAEQGQVASQTALGRALLEGTGVPKQQLRGVHWLREAAYAGDPEAQAMLGAVFVYGIGRSRVRPNDAKAQKWLLSASEQGVAQAQYDLAVLYLKRDATQDGLVSLRKAVAQDHPQAQTLLSSLFREGRGVPQNEAESLRLLRRGAELGDPEAQNEYGVALRDGTRVERDLPESFRWFEKAAMSGNIDAQFNLGRAYFYGAGVKQDRVRGVAWLEVCRAETYRDAIRELGRVRGQLTPAELAAVEGVRQEITANLGP